MARLCRLAVELDALHALLWRQGRAEKAVELGYVRSALERYLKATPEYWAYHARVVEALVAGTGENNRGFWDKECDYLEDFAAGTDATEAARQQIDV